MSPNSRRWRWRRILIIGWPRPVRVARGDEGLLEAWAECIGAAADGIGPMFCATSASRRLICACRTGHGNPKDQQSAVMPKQGADALGVLWGR